MTTTALPTFTTEELMALRDRCLEIAHCEGLSPTWARAYWRLADSAHYLELLMHRNTLSVVEVTPNPE